MKDKDQAEHALDYLHHCHDIETGGCFSDMTGRRDLRPKEQKVKDYALDCLLKYFGAEAARDEASSEKKSDAATPPAKEETPV